MVTHSTVKSRLGKLNIRYMLSVLVVTCWCVGGVWGIRGTQIVLETLHNNLTPLEGSRSYQDLSDLSRDGFDPRQTTGSSHVLLVLDALGKNITESEDARELTMWIKEELLYSDNSFCRIRSHWSDRGCSWMNVSGYHLLDPNSQLFLGGGFLDKTHTRTVVVLHGNTLYTSPRWKVKLKWLQDVLLQHVSRKYEHSLTVSFSGVEAIMAAAEADAARDIKNVECIALFACLGLLILYTGPVVLVVLITLPSSTLLSGGILGIMAQRQSFASFAPAIFLNILLAMGLDYNLFLITRYREEIQSGRSNLEAVDVMLRTAGKTILVSGSVLICSFSGMVATELTMISTLGKGCMVVVSCMMLASITLTPALLIILPIHSCYNSSNMTYHRVLTLCHVDHQVLTWRVHLTKRLKTFWLRLGSICLYHPGTVIICILLVMLPVCSQAPRLKLSTNIQSIVSRNNNFSQTMDNYKTYGINIGLSSPILIGLKTSTTGDPPPHTLPPTCRDDDTSISDLVSIHLGYDIAGCADIMRFFTHPCDPRTRLNRLSVGTVIRHHCPLSCGACKPGRVPSDTDQSMTIFSERYFETNQRIAKSIVDYIQPPSTMTVVRSVAFPFGEPLSYTDARFYLDASLDATKFNSPRGCAYRTLFLQLSNNHYSTSLIVVDTELSTLSDSSLYMIEYARTTSDQYSNYTHAVVVGGITVMYDVIQDMIDRIPTIFLSVTTVCVCGVSLLVFGSVMISVRLLSTILVTLMFVGGSCVLVFQDFLGHDIFWLTVLIAVPIIIGLTLDYDIYLISRIYNHRTRGRSTSDAIMLGLTQTGNVINVAGMIMIISFSTLLFMPELVLQQLGFALTVASFIDTFVVRPLLVPSLMSIGNPEWNWWPSKHKLFTLDTDLEPHLTKRF